MRAIFIGSVQFSQAMLEGLVSRESVQVVGVCTLKTAGADSDRADLTAICARHRIPVRYTPDINDQDVFDWIESLAPEVIFCFGWSRLIGEPLLSLAPRGVVGYHPTALPANRGRHPLIWALALGLESTGSTFFTMNEGTDSGNILSQRTLPILDEDNAKVLYERITSVALSQIDEMLEELTRSAEPGTPQDEHKATYWRKRGQADGQIDWRMPARGIRNLVRALSPPYVGAHFMYLNEAYTVWDSELSCEPAPFAEPGKVLKADGEGLLVKCGVGSLLLTKVDPIPLILAGEYL